MHRPIQLLFVLLFLTTTQMVAAASPQSQKLTWVKDGQALAQIILSDTPAPEEIIAAHELQHHVERLTAAVLPIVHEKDFKDKSRYPIYIGRTTQLQSQDDLSIAALYSGSFYISVRHDAAYFVGTFAAATREAVMRWLMSELGVRWVMPGDRGITFPQTGLKATLNVSLRNDEIRPAFESWRIQPLKPNYDLISKYWDGAKDDTCLQFLQRQGLGMVGPSGQFGASYSFKGYFTSYWEREKGREKLFVQKHPSWFAKGYPNASQPPQLCYSDEWLINNVVLDTRWVFNGNPLPYGAQGSNDFFAVVPNDNSQYCMCVDCKKAGASQLPEAMVPDWPTSSSFASNVNSDYFFGFVDKIAREVAKTNANKYISTQAYHDYAYPPKQTLSSNIAVQLCLDVRRHDDQVWKNQYNAWVQGNNKDRPFWVWVYTCFPAQTASSIGFAEFPGTASSKLSEAIKIWHRDGIRGWFYDGIAEPVDFYVATRLWREPELDYDMILTEFFDRSYGPAARPIEQIYREMQSAFLDPNNYPAVYQHQTQDIAWGKLGTPERVARWNVLMEKAVAAGGTQDQQYRTQRFKVAVIGQLNAGSSAYQKMQDQASGL